MQGDGTRAGESMAAPLLEDWISKRVAVYLGGVHLEGRLLSDSGHARTIEAIEDRDVERLFVS
jgi:hypothetical protein